MQAPNDPIPAAVMKALGIGLGDQFMQALQVRALAEDDACAGTKFALQVLIQ